MTDRSDRPRIRLRDLRTRERQVGTLGGAPILVRWNAVDGGEVVYSNARIEVPQMSKEEFQGMTRAKALDLCRSGGEAHPRRDSDEG